MVAALARLNRSEVNSLPPEQLSTLFNTRLGLVLGPGAVFGSGSMRQLAHSLAGQLTVPTQDRLDHVGDDALRRGMAETSVRDAVQNMVSGLVVGPITPHIASVPWTSVLSACVDSVFDEQFRLASERRPLSHTVTVVNELHRAVPPRSAPVFKLLGSVARGDSVISTDSYSLRRGTWPAAVRAFADAVRNTPVLCLGMSECPWVLWDLVGTMAAQPASTIGGLVLLSDDPLVHDHTLRRLTANRIALIAVESELRVVLGLAAQGADTAEQQALPLTHGGDSLGHALRNYSELAVVVGDRLHSSVSADQVNQLHELLFSPAQPRWDAFAHNLDFPRSATRDGLYDIELCSKSATPGSGACVVSGGAASGKTTVLKRLAFDLASRGHDVLWLLPWFYQDTQPVLLQLFREVYRVRSNESRLIVFLDDPMAFGTLTAHDVVAAAESAGIEIVLVVAARTSEWKTRENRVFVGSLQVLSHTELADHFDETEWAALSAYLVRLGVFPTVDDATVQVAQARQRQASDILSTLYWMLPATRRHISLSVQDEYFRLGDSAGLSKVVIGDLAKDSTLLQQAYEMIAVAERFRTPVPVETLVSALGVRYDEWLDAAAGEGPAWGLFYADQAADGETVSYRTRNAVVTDVIVRTINGGDLSHAGELRVLTTLISGCTGSRPVYREFCVRILVPFDNLGQFEYSEGLALYEAAEAALPYPDKTLVHHKGLWIKNYGRDPIVAKEVLNEALNTPVFPYASRAEADEHIHTSLAATALDAVKQQIIGQEDGKREILQHLDRARSSRFFNPNAVHVEASLVLDLARTSGDTPDGYALLNRALALIDRTMLLLKSQSARSTVTLHDADELRVLEAKRLEILGAAGDRPTIEANADSQFASTGRQDGFILAARSLYQDAVSSEKGSDFHAAFSYCEERLAKVTASAAVPRSALLEVALDIYYHWRIVRKVVAGSTFTIDWELVRRYCDVVLRSSASPDPFHEYLYALTMAHLGHWPQAMALFANLRRGTLPRSILWAPRDFFLSPDGTPRRVQGEVRFTAERGYLYVADLHHDFLLNRGETWPKEGETAHAYIRFAFGGPTASKLGTLR